MVQNSFKRNVVLIEEIVYVIGAVKTKPKYQSFRQALLNLPH